MDFSKLDDNRLLTLSREGTEGAGSELVVRYRPLVKKIARPFFLAGGDMEDLIQEGMLGLVYAMSNYDPSGSASFKTYTSACIKNRILSAIRSSRRDKHKPLNDSAPLCDDFYDLPTPESAALGRPAEQELIDKERRDEFISLCRNELTPLENRVLELFLDGYSYAQIGDICGKPLKSVDSALQRIRKKLASRQK